MLNTFQSYGSQTLSFGRLLPTFLVASNKTPLLRVCDVCVTIVRSWNWPGCYWRLEGGILFALTVRRMVHRIFRHRHGHHGHSKSWTLLKQSDEGRRVDVQWSANVIHTINAFCFKPYRVPCTSVCLCLLRVHWTMHVPPFRDHVNGFDFWLLWATHCLLEHFRRPLSVLVIFLVT